MERSMIDLWVGIFVAAGIIALMVLALKVGNASTTFNTGDTYRINAEFENIGGLKARAPGVMAAADFRVRSGLLFGGSTVSYWPEIRKKRAPVSIATVAERPVVAAPTSDQESGVKSALVCTW